MHLDNLIRDIESKTGLGRVMQIFMAGLMVVVIVLSAAILTMDRTVRTVFVPPEITKSFWVDGRKLSPEYLEQMGEWVVYLFATVTPSSVDYKSSQILKYVHPSVHGELAVRFKAGAARIKRENLSRFFTPSEVRFSEIAQAIAFIGTSETWVADKRLPQPAVRAYLVVFDWDGSNTTIKELRETDPKNPFAPVSEQMVQESTESARQAEVGSSVIGGENLAPAPAPAPAFAPTSSQSNVVPPTSALPPAPPPAASASTQSALQNGQIPQKDKP